MPSDPNIILSGYKPPPVAPPPDALSMISQLSQLKSASIENQLRQQQIQTAQATQANVQADADQKTATNRAYNTLGQTLKDPNVAGRVGEGDFSDIDPLGLDPRVVDQFKKSILAQQKAKTEQGTAQQTLNDTKHKAVADSLQGLLSLQDGQGNALKGPALDDAIKAAYPGTLSSLIADGTLNHGTFPDAVSGADDVRNLASHNNLHAGLNRAGMAISAAQQKIATDRAAELKDTGAANDSNANAALANFKLGLMKDASPENLGTSVDKIIDPAQYPAQNAQAKQLGALALKYGGPEAAQKAVQDVYGQIADVQKARALVPIDVGKAVATERATGPLKVQQAIDTQKALAANSPEMFAGISDPSSRRTAQADYQKLTADYLDKAQSSQQLQDFITAAQSGNKAAPGLIPLSELRSIVNRVNRSELDAVSSGAGSLLDRVQGKLNGLVDGQPIPPDVLADTGRIAQVMAKNARASYENKVAALGATYGGGVRPVAAPGAETRTYNGATYTRRAGSSDPWVKQ